MERYRILPITECYGGMEHRLYPVVLFGPEDAVLVDCGYPDAPLFWRERWLRLASGRSS